MKNLLNNKILIIITIFAIILSLGSNVLAFDLTISNNTYSVDTSIFPEYSNYNHHFIIYKDGNNYIELLCTNDNITNYGSTYIVPCAFDYKYSLTNNSITQTLTNLNGTFSSAPGYYVLWSDFDLITPNGTLVFQGAPQEQVAEVPEITTTLVEQGTQAQMGETLLATIKTYLVYLVIFVVSMIAIWKAVRFLRNVLKTS